MPIDTKKNFTLKEIAEKTGFSVGFLRNAIVEGQIAYFQRKKKAMIFISGENIIRFVQENTKKQQNI